MRSLAAVLPTAAVFLAVTAALVLVEDGTLALVTDPSFPIKSMSSNGPILKPPKVFKLQSIVSKLAMPSS
jgi:hypothetical protein